jgi:hypothetical protein
MSTTPPASTSVAHRFKKRTFNRPSFCFLCNQYIFGVGKIGYKCRTCHYVCHKRCLGEVPNSCLPTSAAREDDAGVQMAHAQESFFSAHGSKPVVSRFNSIDFLFLFFRKCVYKVYFFLNTCKKKKSIFFQLSLSFFNVSEKKKKKKKKKKKRKDRNHFANKIEIGR